MKNRTLRLLPLTAMLALFGCEPVDNGAATRAKGWNGVLTDNVLQGDRDVFLDIDESTPAADACAKTTVDAHEILSKHCGSCHDAGAASQGVPMFDFIMNDDKLISEPWVRQTGTLHFLVPGDPDNSQIYVRAAIKRDMPPLYMDISNPDPPRVPFNQGGVLREWIEKCMK